MHSLWCCTLCLQFPGYPASLALDGEETQGVGTWDWNLGSTHRGAFSSQKAQPPSCCPSRPTHCFEPPSNSGPPGHFLGSLPKPSLCSFLVLSIVSSKRLMFIRYSFGLLPFLYKYIQNIFFLMVGGVFSSGG